jgi:transcriptional regulator GlxA family with amidase domain
VGDARHALFGTTPHQYRIDARLTRARELLITTERRVIDICLDIGFTSLGSFSSLFARRVGAPRLTTGAARDQWSWFLAPCRSLWPRVGCR